MDVTLSKTALKVLEARYLMKKGNKIVEKPIQLFERVAKNIAEAEELYKGNKEEAYKAFFQLMTSLNFLPNSPTLMNAGLPLQQLSACFVLPVDDSMESIFSALKYTALIHKSGGGTGFSFSRIRPVNDLVHVTGGIASGPISFMKVFDGATEVIKQGGKRRGANMAILRVDHPDILDFIKCKDREGVLANFNISVALTKEFFIAYEKKQEYNLINPRNSKVIGKLKAKEVFDLIAKQAWKNGEPGIIFIDNINDHNPTTHVGLIESTNPCGEQPLLPYESCNLGSVNLSNMAVKGQVDWNLLEQTVKNSVWFLDNVIDKNKYPIANIEEMTMANRKIGLGVMGWADMCIRMNIKYNSEAAIKLAEKVMKFVNDKGMEKSVELAGSRGTFPNFKGSSWDKKNIKMRNATITTIAPTGSISIIAGASSGIEPLFALGYLRKISIGDFLEIHPLFEKAAKEKGFYSKALVEKVIEKGSIKDI
ncbi:MAG: adenosylcobalamin-dependent ribonucleoside-diphosphate reductase, partial [Spirochaetes bacterium]|nr:adenosylcobalamin-dependent ribonucleoside-diphosphate reductase [Spirochaetota bacterium]